MSQSTNRKIVRNSGFNILRGAIAFPITLILTPLVLTHVGFRDFGIWSLLYVLIQSAAVFDLGLSGSLVKFVASLYEKKSFSELSRIVSTAVIAYSLLACILFFLVAILAKPIVGFVFKISGGEQGRFVLVLLLAAMALSIQLVASVFTAYLQGLQRMDLANLVFLAGIVLNFAGATVLLRRGLGLASLMIVQFVAAVLALLVGVIVSKSLVREVSWSPKCVDVATFRKILPLSFAVQFLNIQTLLFYQFDKLILSMVLGPVFAGSYEIAARPLNSIRSVPLTFVQPVTPAVSELQSRDDRSHIACLLAALIRYVLLFGVPIFFAVIFFSKPLLLLWLDERSVPNFALVATTLQLLALTYLINLTCGTLTYFAVGLGEHACVGRYSIVASALQVTLTTVLVLSVGYVGAPLGILLATAISNAYLALNFSRATGFTSSSLLSLAVKPVECALFAGLLALFGEALFSWPQSHETTLLVIGLYFLVFTVSILAIGYVSFKEVKKLRNLLILTFGSVVFDAAKFVGWDDKERPVTPRGPKTAVSSTTDPAIID